MRPKLRRRGRKAIATALVGAAVASAAPPAIGMPRERMQAQGKQKRIESVIRRGGQQAGQAQAGRLRGLRRLPPTRQPTMGRRETRRAVKLPGRPPKSGIVGKRAARAKKAKGRQRLPRGQV